MSHHDIAALVFGAMVWAAQQPPLPNGAAYPNYSRYGNSNAETQARIAAQKIAAAIRARSGGEGGA